MANILLFGSHEVFNIPSHVVGWLNEFNKEGHNFIVGDRKGADSTFHKILSSIGAKRVMVYCNERVKNNSFDFSTNIFRYEYNDNVVTAYNSRNSPVTIFERINSMDEFKGSSKYSEFRDKQMILDCDAAICLYDGKSKTVEKMIQMLNILGKQCHVVNMA